MSDWSDLSQEKIIDIYKKPEKEREQYIENYNKKVKELNNKIKKIMLYLINVPNTAKKKAVFQNLYLEIPIWNKLRSIPLGKETAMFVPDFEQAVNLYLLTGCQTAFMSNTPLRMVIFKDFAEKLTDIGLLFIMAHEANHVIRKHFARQQYRDSRLWNVATDLVINHRLLTNKLRNLKNELSEKDENIQEITNEHIFKPEYQETLKHFNYIGNRTPPEELIGTEHDMSDWFDAICKEHPEYTEEIIYKFLAEKNNSGDVGENHMPDGFQMHQKSESQSIRDLYKEMFGDKAEDMLNKLRKTIRDFGVPTNKQEQAKQEQDNKETYEEFVREWHKITNQYKGYGHNEVAEILKRDQDVTSKTKFIANIRTAIMKKNKSGEWIKTDNLTRFSKQMKTPAVHTLLGFDNQLRFFAKEQQTPTFNVLVICDSSGSVSIEEFSKQFLNEIRNLVINYNFELSVISADTDTVESSRFTINKDNFDQYDENGFPFAGGGGTDMFFPIAKELVMSKVDYDAVIVLSDGGYMPYTKSELMEAMSKMHDNMLKEPSKYKDELKRIRKKVKTTNKGIREYINPTIILLNTEELYSGKEKLETYSHTELQEYLLDTDFCATIHQQRLNK